MDIPIDIRQVLVESIRNEREAILQKVFREYLGQDDEDIIPYLYGRAHLIGNQNSAVYYIDGDPVLEIHKTEFVWEDQRLVAQIKWRKYF